MLQIPLQRFGDGESRLMRIRVAFKAPNSLGKNSFGGVIFHLISASLSPPKILEVVHTF